MTIAVLLFIIINKNHRLYYERWFLCVYDIFDLRKHEHLMLKSVCAEFYTSRKASYSAVVSGIGSIPSSERSTSTQRVYSRRAVLRSPR